MERDERDERGQVGKANLRQRILREQQGRICALKNPEREGDRCLDYENIKNALRLKVNVFKGTLER